MASASKHLWYVQEFSDERSLLSLRLPLRTNGKQIQTLLQRLAARHLSPEQLAGLAMPRQRTDALRPIVRDRSVISLEVGSYRYVAQIVSEFQLAEIQAGACA